MIRPGYLRRCMRERLRVWATLESPPCWLLVVAWVEEREQFTVVRSHDRGSFVERLDVESLGGRGLLNAQTYTAPEPVTVEPLDLGTRELVRVRTHGHNGVAEAVALLAMRPTPARFAYLKPNESQAQERDVVVEWADGDRFGGRDNDRGGSPRTFRLDRVTEIRAHESAVSLPVWVAGVGYVWGLP